MSILHHTAKIKDWRLLKIGVRVEWDALKTRSGYLRTYRGTVVEFAGQEGGIAVQPDLSEYPVIIWWLDNLRTIAPPKEVA
ncbi:MAG TPA: hypothetical protein VK742_20335 [Candidatus Sulfotelmatobacter sp.]|jgi:hypothetical protein|nr:hypothetical protein [Candidatus Sulfotelmatobacter sp.]